MEENASATKRTVITIYPSLEKFKGVFLWQRDIVVAVGSGIESEVNSRIQKE